MICVSIHLVRNAFEASLSDQTTHEWPPHPARAFQALVDVALLADPVERSVLEAIEQAEPPHIIVPTESQPLESRRNFVVTNLIGDESKYGAIPLREAKGVRTWPRVVVSSPDLHFVWPELSLNPEQLGVLDSIAKRVGYFGRSTSPATLRAKNIDDPVNGPSAQSNRRVWRPLPQGVGTPLRVASCGYLALLERAYQANMSAHEVAAAEVEYSDREDQAQVVCESEYDPTLLVKRFETMIDGRRVPELTNLVRSAFLKHLCTYIPDVSMQPAALCGHPNLGEQTWSQVMFLALTNVGHEYADGVVKGLALALPRDLEGLARRAALAAWRDITELTLGSRGRAQLTAVEGRSNWALSSSRWTLASFNWATVTPIVPNRFCSTNTQRRAYVMAACVEAGLPEPLVKVFSGPQVKGALALNARRGVRHAEAIARPNFHASLRFPDKVRGPLVLGDMRHYGLGLCIPVNPVIPVAEGDSKAEETS